MTKATPNTNGMAFQNNVYTGVKIQINPTESHSHELVISRLRSLRAGVVTPDDTAPAINTTLQEAIKDGVNIAYLIANCKSGLLTLYRVYDALERLHGTQKAEFMAEEVFK